MLAMSERWLEVVGVPEETPVPGAPEGTTIEVPLQVVPFDPSADGFTGKPVIETIAIHSSFLPGIEWAIGSGGKAYVSIASEQFVREMVAVTMIDPVDGPFFFAGLCQYDGMTEGLLTRLGPRYDRVLSKVLGRTDREGILALLSTEVPAHTTGPTILNPEDAPADLLNQLARITLAIEVPAAWSGSPLTLCPKIDEGWNDCIPLASAAGKPVPLDVYVGPSRKMELWVTDANADLANPITSLGVLDLSSLPPDMFDAPQGATAGVEVRGTLRDDGTVEDPSVVLVGAS
jgi:hypothetical protein